MEIYEETYEGITYRLKKLEEEAKEKKGSGKTTEIPEDMDDDDALDMFMETAKDGEKEKGKEDEAKKKEAEEESKPKEAPIVLDDEVISFTLSAKNGAIGFFRFSFGIKITFSS